jgi:hypothetical protein
VSTKICTNDEALSARMGCSTIYAANEAQDDLLCESDKEEELIVRLEMPEEEVTVSRHSEPDIVVDSYKEPLEEPNIVVIDLKDIDLGSALNQ